VASRFYGGALAYRLEETGTSGDLPSTRTQIPGECGQHRRMLFKLAAIPCEAVGLPDWNSSFANQIKVHPMALLEPERAANLEAAAPPIAKAHRRPPPSSGLLPRPAQPGLARLAARLSASS